MVQLSAFTSAPPHTEPRDVVLKVSEQKAKIEVTHLVSTNRKMNPLEGIVLFKCALEV